MRMDDIFPTVILANGAFPVHEIPLRQLRKAERLICCDGAVENLLAFGMQPDWIVGDMDSLPKELKNSYSSIIQHYSEQETNDLTKSVRFCCSRGWTKISILGATGKREDHTLGNLSLLADYAEIATVQALTDYGIFTPLLHSSDFQSFRGQQISIFSLDPEVEITADGLVYPLVGRRLSSWWQGTLNEATGSSFSLKFNSGKLLLFREYNK